MGVMVRIPHRPRGRGNGGPAEGGASSGGPRTPSTATGGSPRRAIPLRFIEKAVVHHDAIRQRSDRPAWKYYYESRNMLYLHWHVMHRMGWLPRNFSRLVGKALLRQKTDRLRCLVAMGRGLFDGAFGRLGIRYPVVALRERDVGASPPASPGEPHLS